MHGSLRSLLRSGQRPTSGRNDGGGGSAPWHPGVHGGQYGIPGQVAGGQRSVDSEPATHRATWTRELTPSLLKMLSTWVSIVRSEIDSRDAASRFVIPSATSRATSCSRAER